MACDSIQSCTSLLGSALSDTSFEGGVVKNRMACKFSASDTSFKLICHRYGKATSVNSKGETCKNIMGVIYEYSTGSRGTTLPAPGTSFYIHVKNLGSTSKITKVSIKYKYESYAKVDLYDAITEGATNTTQPILLAERSTL